MNISQIIFFGVQPILLRHVTITHCGIIKRGATRSGIRTNRIMNVFLRLLYMMFSIITVTRVPYNALAGISRRQAKATNKIMGFSFFPIFRIMHRSFERRRQGFIQHMRLTDLFTHVYYGITSRVFVSRTRCVMILLTVREGVFSRMSRIAGYLYPYTETFARFKRTNL